MKSLILVAGVFSLAVAGCDEITGVSQGNPDGTAYAGSPGSVYSVAANPPQTMGAVTYDASAVQPAPIDIPSTPSGVTSGTLPAQDYGPIVQHH